MRAMLMLLALVAVVVAIAGVRTGAQAPGTERKLDLSFDGQGYATLVAENVSVADVFAAWARVGGTHITNAEKLPAGLISVEFDNTPEYELAQSLLRLSKARNAGIIVAPRLVSAPVTPSRLGVINILPTSSPSTSYMGAAASSPMYPTTSPDDEIPPVMPVVGPGPAAAPGSQPAPPPARAGGPGVAVVPVGGPGTNGRGGDQTPLPGNGRGLSSR